MEPREQWLAQEAEDVLASWDQTDEPLLWERLHQFADELDCLVAEDDDALDRLAECLEVSPDEAYSWLLELRARLNRDEDSQDAVVLYECQEGLCQLADAWAPPLPPRNHRT